MASVSAGWTHAIALLDSGRKVLVWGRNNYRQCGVPQDQRIQLRQAAAMDLDARKVLAGSEHCVCLTSSGSVLAWGWNEHGNCGITSEECVPTPRLVDLSLAGGGGQLVTDIYTGSAHSFAALGDNR